MGHDITAYRNGVDRDALLEELGVNDYGAEDWSERYGRFRDRTQIAYNRRNAGDNLNGVLYLALGVYDEAYAGCSGNGSELDITLDQLEAARKILDVKNFAKMTRPHNLADDVFSLFQQAFGKGEPDVVVQPEDRDVNVSREKEFIDKCITYLKEAGDDSITIYFG